MEKMYDIRLPLDGNRQRLYISGDGFELKRDIVFIPDGKSADFGTYFNALSVKKWRQYTSLESLEVRIMAKGTYELTFYSIEANGCRTVKQQKLRDSAEILFEKGVLAREDIQCLGFRITASGSDCEFLGGAYYGQYTHVHDVRIGITICTFHREEYLHRNLQVLEEVCRRNPAFSVMVIDNGSTLEERRDEADLQIIHNPNYGGAGGFTRGLIEQVEQGKNTHVILMDDDILMEPSIFDRVYALLCHLRPEKKMNMLSGAMLDMDHPEIQHENTAYWHKIRLHSLGGGLDLSEKASIYKNESIPGKENQYAAWWFCCIPIEVVKKIGYPLPVFIKGDDMEYSIRNHREIMTMNGICVWHEAFAKKVTPVINYFSDRNMLIVNHFAEGCNRWTFLLGATGRLLRSIWRSDWDSVRALELALHDLGTGFEGITSMPGDLKLESVKHYVAGKKNLLASICCSVALLVSQFLQYGSLNKQYRSFRTHKLADSNFWRGYLNY